MKLKYTAKKNERINYKFMGFTTDEHGWWFNYNSNKWEQNPEPGEKGCSSHQSCKTMKAFRRKLKKCPKGVRFFLINRWMDHEIEELGSMKYNKN